MKVGNTNDVQILHQDSNTVCVHVPVLLVFVRVWNK